MNNIIITRNLETIDIHDSVGGHQRSQRLIEPMYGIIRQILKCIHFKCEILVRNIFGFILQAHTADVPFWEVSTFD